MCATVQLFGQNDTTAIATSRQDTTTATPISQNSDTVSTLQDTTSYHEFQNDTIAEAVHIEDYIKRRGTMMTVAVKNNPEAKGRNTLQFLNTLPGVDGINIYGNKESAKVYVNGRELNIPGSITDYLKSLQAEDVRQIQILPTHGARYSADNKGGVIRIQLRSKEEDRISGNANMNASVHTYNGGVTLKPSVNLNYMGRKLSSYTYVTGTWLQDERTASKNIIGEGEDRITESQTNDRGFYCFTADQSLLWSINDNHEIGFAVEGFAKPREWSTYKIYSGNRINDDISLYDASATLNYNWSYGDKGSGLKFTADFFYSYDTDDQDYFYSSSEDEEMDNSLADDIAAPYEHSDAITEKYTWSLKADGDHNFNDEKSGLSYGAFWLGMNAKDRYSQYETPDTYGFNERMYGAYAEFFTSFLDDRLDLDLGIRYEGYRSEWTYRNPYIVNESFDRADGSNNFNSFFPSASLSYRSDNRKSYTSLEYSRDISRPNMYAYNPTVSRTSDNVFFVSPTTMLPEFDNRFILVETINNTHTLRLSYSWRKNIYDYTYEQVGDQIYQSRSNIGSSREVRLYYSTRFWIVKKWLRFNVSASGQYTQYVHTTTGDYGTWDGNVSADATLYMPKSWIVQVGGYYMTPQKYPTYWSSGYRDMDATVQKSFKSDLVLQVRFNQIVANFKRKTYSRAADVNYTTFNTSNFRSLTVYLTYRFGSSKVHVKRVRGNDVVYFRSAGK
ncbi:MAG: outer membrane beta-barrel protein [Clostridia bacterium]|nr:outer membrane beta-barrel protein [Clostridia bacterium]